jgi:hypothetical protein
MATAHPEIDLRREGTDAPPLLDIVKAEKELSDTKLRENVTNWLLTLFCASTIATYVLIYFWGFRIISLPPGFVHWLGAATIGQTAGLLLIVVRSLFPKARQME